MNEFPLNELNERQFDRQRAFGLLLLNVSRNELTLEKVFNKQVQVEIMLYSYKQIIFIITCRHIPRIQARPLLHKTFGNNLH